MYTLVVGRLRPRRPALLLGVVAAVLIASALVGLLAHSLPQTYVLLLVGGTMLAAVALRDMRAALTLTVLGAATIPLSIGTGTQSAINAAMALVVLFTGLWVLRMALSRRIRLAPSFLNAPLLAFLVAAGLSWLATTIAADARIPLPGNLLVVQAGQYAIFALTAAAFFLTANHPLPQRGLKVWTAFIVGTGMAMVALDVLPGVWRISSWSGGLLMWPWVLLVAQMLFNPGMSRSLKALGIGALAIWVYWSATISIGWKSSWAPTVIAVFLLLLLKSRRWFLIALVVMAALVVVVGPDRVAGALLITEEYSFTPVRWNLWVDVIRFGARSFVLGLGPAAYIFYWDDLSFESWSYRYVDPYAFTRAAYAPPAHNMYADVFAQTGAVGLLLFLLVIAGGIRLGVQAIRRPLTGFARAYARAVLCGFAALAVASFVFAEWLMPYVYNLGLAGFRHSVYSWLLLGTLVWLGRPGELDAGGTP